jgi:orotate phosphoribosyltransferase
VRPGDKVILVDDVASSGQTLADAFDVITDFGCEVIKAITIVDRQEGAETLLAQRGVPWTPLVTIEELRIDELADSKTGFTNTTDM